MPSARLTSPGQDCPVHSIWNAALNRYHIASEFCQLCLQMMGGTPTRAKQVKAVINHKLMRPRNRSARL